MTRPIKRLIAILVLGVVLRLALSVTIYSGDLNNHVAWGNGILRSGFHNAYYHEYPGVMQPTYPPLALYSFTTSVGLYRLLYSAATFINRTLPVFPSGLIWALEDQDVLPAFTKITSIVADIGIGFLIFRFSRSFIATMAYIFNPAVWYLSSIWGQIESLPIFFFLLALWSTHRKHFFATNLAFTAALLFKQSSIIFAPIFAILSWRRFGLPKTIIGITLQFSVVYLVYLPFAPSISLLWPIQIYVDRLQTGSGSNWVTDHAFNPWIWTTHLQKIPDTIPVIGSVTAGQLGLFLFGTFASLVLIRLTLSQISFSNLFLATSLMPILSFLLLTKMHERYLAPALPFLALAAAFRPRLWPIFIVLSLAHLANLYHEWWFPRIPVLVNWLSFWNTIQLMATIITTCSIIVLTYYLKSEKS
ncbi:hypothetical protein A2634_04950 [Candidatus Amesbacteria bacterium RIFCSPHIGHO2_01_FULL_48_32]|uniref:Glycosyltransferase RgtA/B/C/D-like domain-containing protein n=1 Tax=Candidatus Amesbacteria bacterium RIFCSPLOWO2_01_FULL_48_25 TaxID=1797259 RepID=A0A1F4ZDG8_9BACT|nr:MAG: hypothetical protein A2634_04950 [Candidatus Amesbacteria bacterium RIFCSPHIGHO2_01_FULL_48_32]OGD04016.1 MAG: hypothetical protein A2989_01300 [Candidatus Amesbacteria bacterium RIFCSPLOWO2_01_FULL_48_25]HJZ05720.1 hypothetical protein [Patescibacteria group bacterium]